METQFRPTIERDNPVVCREKNHVRHQFRGVINVQDNVDFIPSNVRFLQQEALLFVFEDDEAVIKMMIKGRSPIMKHAFRIYRVALDLLFDRINVDQKIQITYFGNTKTSRTLVDQEKFHT